MTGTRQIASDHRPRPRVLKYVRAMRDKLLLAAGSARHDGLAHANRNGTVPFRFALARRRGGSGAADSAGHDGLARGLEGVEHCAAVVLREPGGGQGRRHVLEVSLEVRVGDGLL